MHRVRLIGDPEVPRGLVRIGGARIVDEEDFTAPDIFTREVRVSPEEVEDYRKQLEGPDFEVEVVQ